MIPKDMQIFPYVLARVSGGPFEEMERLNVCCASELIEEMISLRKKLNSTKLKLSDKLYHVIAEMPDLKDKRILLNLKRDLFNEREIPSDRIETLQRQIPSVVNKQLKEYFRLRKEINSIIERGEGVFAEEIAEVRQEFRKLVKNETLQKGLLLSSQSLLKRLPRYLKTDIHVLKKSELNTEKSLIKYLSRLYTKTTPFSTFTNLAMCKVLPKGEHKAQGYINISIKNDQNEVTSHIRLNNYLYAYLKTLLTKNPEIYRHFLLRPNPTIKQNEDHYHYLTNSNNIESFQRVPANPVLEVFRKLASEKKEGMVFKEMVEKIINNEYIDASGEDIEAYMTQLIEYGFLEFNFGVSGIDPDWDIKLRKKLSPIAKQNPLIKGLTDTLKQVRQLADTYGKANLNRRKQILEKAYEQFRSICMELHKAAGLPEEERKPYEEYLARERKKQQEKIKEEQEKRDSDEKEKESQEKKDEPFKHKSSTIFSFKPEQMFYEDTSVNISMNFDQAGLTSLISPLHHLLQKMHIFEGHFDEREKMKHFFTKKYGKEENVDLLTFYEDYYREVRKPEAEWESVQRIAAAQRDGQKVKEDNKELENNEPEKDRQQVKTPDAPDIPRIKARQDRNKAWLDQFAEILKKHENSNHEIKFKQQEILETNRKIRRRRSGPKTACSYGTFLPAMLPDLDLCIRQFELVDEDLLAFFICDEFYTIIILSKLQATQSPTHIMIFLAKPAPNQNGYIL